jgi:hypothetical protein
MLTGEMEERGWEGNERDFYSQSLGLYLQSSDRNFSDECDQSLTLMTKKPFLLQKRVSSSLMKIASVTKDYTR